MIYRIQSLFRKIASDPRVNPNPSAKSGDPSTPRPPDGERSSIAAASGCASGSRMASGTATGSCFLPRVKPKPLGVPPIPRPPEGSLLPAPPLRPMPDENWGVSMMLMLPEGSAAGSGDASEKERMRVATKRDRRAIVDVKEAVLSEMMTGYAERKSPWRGTKKQVKEAAGAELAECR